MSSSTSGVPERVGSHSTKVAEAFRAALLSLDAARPAEEVRDAAVALAEHGFDEDGQAALRVRERLEVHRRRETELVALQETARDLIRLRDVDQVLQAIVRRARQLLGTDVGYLSIYDPDRADFYVRATEGAVSAEFRTIRVPQDVGICGTVARTRLPQFATSYADDRRFVHEGAIDSGVLEEGIVALLGVPLLVDAEVIGVLFVASRSARTFLPEQIALLDSLSAHAAVGIENARLFQESSDALQRAEDANRELRQRTAEVQSAADVHERLTALLTRGGDLADVAEVVSDALDGPVEIVDHLSTIAVSRRRPDQAARPSSTAVRAAWRRAADLGRAVVLDAEGVWIASIGEPGQPLGMIALHRDATMSRPQVRTLERAAMMATIVLVARERIATAEHRALADLIGDLLRRPDGHGGHTADLARHHGLPLDQPLAMVVCAIGSMRPAVAVTTVRDALHGIPSLVAEFEDDLIVVLRAADGRSALRRLHPALAGRAPGPVTAVLSKPVSGGPSLPSAHRRARRCVRLLSSLGREGSSGREEDLSPYAALLADHGEEDLQRFLDDTLAPLRRHDDTKGTDLARTLLVFLDHAQKTVPAAESLHLHPNTLRQRMEKVERLVPDWDEPARRLEIHLALRVSQLHRDAL